jgi:hypothetical protein
VETRVAVFHGFILGQSFGTRKPAFLAGLANVPKLTLCGTAGGCSTEVSENPVSGEEREHMQSLTDPVVQRYRKISKQKERENPLWPSEKDANSPMRRATRWTFPKRTAMDRSNSKTKGESHEPPPKN